MNLIKKNIEELKRNSDRFHVATAVKGSLIYEWDLQTGKLRWIGDIEQIFGVPEKQLPESVQGFIDFVHLDDRDILLEEFENERKSGFSKSCCCRIMNKCSGDWRSWHLSIVNVDRDGDLVKKIYGICREAK